jgi:hypothetical protein
LTLEIIEGADVGRNIALKGPVEIGRDPAADVVLADGLVSRHHARFSVDSGSVSVQDLDSLNGTFVNSRQIHGAVRLRPGDQVLMGTTVMQLRTAADITTQASVAVAIPAGLAIPARRPDYVPAGIAVDSGSLALDDLLDVKIKRKARVAPIGIFVLIVLVILILLALKSQTR